MDFENHGSQLPPKSLCFYDGPSQIDGQRVLGLVTGLRAYTASENPKTGPMVQTWILRADQPPNQALQTGADYSICGACPLRPYTAKQHGGVLCYASCSGGRAAIVNIWRSWNMGNIPLLSGQAAAAHLMDRKVRVGAYGDPAALPYPVWCSLLAYTEAAIGYTHQWRTCDRRFAHLVMASVESMAQRDEARERGYRTFRIRAESQPRGAGEVVCPGSAEAGKRLTCDQCLACNGQAENRKGDIVIFAHGSPTHKGGTLGDL